MQVNVLIARAIADEAPTFLVLPYGPQATIPRHLQGLKWRNFATTMTDDKLVGLLTECVEQSIARDGYALVAPTS